MNLKKVLFACVALVLCTTAKAQLKSNVDECFELTSIVYRLSGAEEYSSNDHKKYITAIDSYFAPYKNHPVINYCKGDLREINEIGYDAVARAALYIEINDGKVLSRSNELHKISAADGRWTEEAFEKYVGLLNDFYRQSKFDLFYLEHSDVRKLAEDRFNELITSINIGWFTQLFGIEYEKYRIVLSLCNGPNNYGPKDIDGTPCSIIGTAQDANGDPLYTEFIIYYVFVHEILHSYCNEIVDRYWTEIEGAAEKIFVVMSRKMRRLAYGNSKSMIKEWLTNLVCTMYIEDNKGSNLNQIIINDIQTSGFVWLDRSAKLMDSFYANRDKYPFIENFMPILVDHLNNTAENINEIIAEFNISNPHVSDVLPENYGYFTTDKDEIIFKFSTAMNGKFAYAISNGIANGKPYWRDSTTLVFPIDIRAKQNGDECTITVTADGFASQKGIPMKTDYRYIFTVNKQ